VTSAQDADASDDRPLDLPDGGLLGAVVRLDLEVSRSLDAIAGAQGLSFADYLVLGVIRRSPGGRSAPTTIANVLERTTGGMTLALDRLESSGLVRRSRHEGDGRRVVVSLTPRGQRVAASVNDALHAWERSLDVPRSTTRLVAILDELTEAVRRQNRRAALTQ
jgi:DNA-binding MarR family transcriptional regulator